MSDKVYKIIAQEITKEVHYIKAEDEQEAREIYNDNKDNYFASNPTLTSIFTGLIDIQVVHDEEFKENHAIQG